MLLIDTGKEVPERKIIGQSLSSVFSGMRLVVKGASNQFRAGIEIFKTMLAHQVDVWQSMPLFPEWVSYNEAKNRQRRDLSDYQNKIIRFSTKTGLPGGFLSCPLPGVHGFLRMFGCRVSIAAGLQQTGFRLCTIAGDCIRVDDLLKALNVLERGWGGPSHGGIIGAPRVGSTLNTDMLIEIVKEGL